MYSEKPKKHDICGSFSDYSNNSYCINIECNDNVLKALFGITDLTFENSPIEIKTKIK